MKKQLTKEEKKRVAEIKEELKKLDKVKDRDKRQLLTIEKFEIEVGKIHD